MADPLPRDEDRQLHMIFDLAHLEGRRMTMPHQILDEAAILVHALRALAVRDARRLHHCRIVAHVIDHANEAVIEHRQRREENFLECRHGGATRLRRSRPRGFDFGFFTVFDRHAGTLPVRARPSKANSGNALQFHPAPFDIAQGAEIWVRGLYRKMQSSGLPHPERSRRAQDGFAIGTSIRSAELGGNNG